MAQAEAGKFRIYSNNYEENNLLNFRQQDFDQENTILQICFASKIDPIKILFMGEPTYELAEFKSTLGVEANRHKPTDSWARLEKR